MQDIVRKVPVAPYVIRYAMKFTRLTRQASKGEVPDFIRDYVTWGAGPRATQFLILGAKARAVLHGRYYVSCEDIRAVAAAGAAAPHHHQLQRRGRGHQARRHRPRAGRHHPARPQRRGSWPSAASRRIASTSTRISWTTPNATSIP